MQTIRSTDEQKLWRCLCGRLLESQEVTSQQASILFKLQQPGTDVTRLVNEGNRLHPPADTEHTGLHAVGGVVAHRWKTGLGLRVTVPPHRRLSRWYLVREKWWLICTSWLIVNATGKHTECNASESSQSVVLSSDFSGFLTVFLCCTVCGNECRKTNILILTLIQIY